MNDQKVDFEKIKELREQIQRLIAERPELAAFQEKIDEALKKAGKNPNNRASALSSMAIDLQLQMGKALADLAVETNRYLKAAKKLEELKDE